ncbi:GrpB family protein [Glutamicibacter ardleyensis]|uniref:GrpB family protein n=1 Tax=Glutamicibacter ardleyensis TaxID=225894 RepID=UPI003FCEE7A8
MTIVVMPELAKIISFHEPAHPEGQSPYLPGTGPLQHVEIADWSRQWAGQFQLLARQIRDVLGWRALVIEHVGSTAVRGLPAKPIIDIDLVVADPNKEQLYIPALESAGFQLVVREPWWYGHRVLRNSGPECNLHVFGYDSPEIIKHRIFRDWLREHPSERILYAEAKRDAAARATEAGEHTMQYNARKEAVIREIYQRAFLAMGLVKN